MAGLRNLAFMATAVQGIQQNAERMRALRAAQLEKKEQDEMRDLQKRKINLEIEEKQRQGELSQFEIDIVKKTLGDQFKAAEANSQVQENAINQEVMATKQQAKTLAGVLKNSAEDFQEESGLAVSIPGMNIGFKKDVGPFRISTPSAPGATILDSRNKALGALKAGGVMSGSELSPFENRESADAYAMQHLGPDYEKTHPQAKKYITKHFGRGEYEKGQVIDTKKGKFTVVGFDDDGEPLVEPAKRR